jgi:hypothetical protein
VTVEPRLRHDELGDAVLDGQGRAGRTSLDLAKSDLPGVEAYVGIELAQQCEINGRGGRRGAGLPARARAAGQLAQIQRVDGQRGLYHRLARHGDRDRAVGVDVVEHDGRLAQGQPVAAGGGLAGIGKAAERGSGVLAEPAESAAQRSRGDIDLALHAAFRRERSRERGIERSRPEIDRRGDRRAGQQVRQSEGGGEPDRLSIPSGRARNRYGRVDVGDLRLQVERLDAARASARDVRELRHVDDAALDRHRALRIDRVADRAGVEPDEGIVQVRRQPPRDRRLPSRERHQTLDIDRREVEGPACLRHCRIDVELHAGRQSASGDLPGIQRRAHLAVPQLGPHDDAVRDRLADTQRVGAQLDIGIEIPERRKVGAAIRRAARAGVGGLGRPQIGIIQHARADARHDEGTIAGNVAGVEPHRLPAAVDLAPVDTIASVRGELDAARGAYFGQRRMRRPLHCRGQGKLGRPAIQQVAQRADVGGQIDLAIVHRAREYERGRLVHAGNGKAKVHAARHRTDDPVAVFRDLAIGDLYAVERKPLKVRGRQPEDVAFPFPRRFRVGAGLSRTCKDDARRRQLDARDPYLIRRQRHQTDRRHQPLGRGRHEAVAGDIAEILRNDPEIGHDGEPDRAAEGYFGVRGIGELARERSPQRVGAERQRKQERRSGKRDHQQRQYGGNLLHDFGLLDVPYDALMRAPSRSLRTNQCPSSEVEEYIRWKTAETRRPFGDEDAMDFPLPAWRDGPRRLPVCP